MKSNILEKISIPFGMAAVISYLSHTTLGDYMWPDYNPLTMDISSLTAADAPNANILGIFTLLYGIFAIIFAVGMILRACRAYNKQLKTGFWIFLIMQTISLIGNRLFPISSDITEKSVQNIMHISITLVVVILTIVFAVLIALGYFKQPKTKKFGKLAAVLAVLIILSEIFNLISMGMGLNILGLSERLTIFSLMVLIFAISNFESFANLSYIDIKKES